MKKSLAMILSVVMMCGLLAGCGSSAAPAATTAAPAATEAATTAAPAATEAAAAETEAAAGAAPAAEISGDYKIRAAYDFLENSYLGTNFTKFAERVEELSGGKVTFDIYGSGSLYKANEALEATMVGDLEMCVVANSNIGNYVPEMLVISLPYMIPNKDAMMEMLNPEGELLSEVSTGLADKNLKLLDIFAFVDSDLSSNKQIKVPTDMKGMKIRVYGQTNANYTDLSGGASVFLSGGEVTQALSANTVDGAWCGVESMVTRKYYEFQDYVCACGMERSDQPVVMNLEWWDSLPAEVQGVIKQAMDDIITDQKLGSYEVTEESRKALAENGAEVYYPTEEEMQEWYAVADQVYEKFYDSIGEDVIRHAVEIKNKF